MWLNFFCFFLLAASLSALISDERTWVCEIISLESYISDRSKMIADFRVVRIRRGVFAFSGELVINFDVAENNTVEYIGYRSATGSHDSYTLLPFAVPRQPVYDFLNNIYKDVLVPNYGNCSNIPQIEKFEPPLERTSYFFDRCLLEGKGLPKYVLEGYYKIIGIFTGEVKWELAFVGKVVSKLY